MMKSIADYIDKKLPILFLIPGLSIVCFILLYPLASNIWISFTNKHLIYPSIKWVGFENYLYTFQEEEFLQSITNTFVWTAGSIILQMIIGYIAATLLNRPVRGIRFFRLALITPYAFPPIIIAYLWKWMSNKLYGIINYTLIGFNIMEQPINWFGQTNTAMMSAIVVNVWFGFPLFTLAILAGFQSIPREQYEVAKIEGASPLQTFWYVTLPNLRTIIGIIVILRTIWVFNTFDLLFLLTNGGPLNATLTLPIYSYKIGWLNGLLGETASVAVFLFIILVVFTFIYFKLFKIEEDKYGT